MPAISLLQVSINTMFVAHYVVGDGRQGWQDKAPYDAIHVGAATASVPEAVRTHTKLYHLEFIYFDNERGILHVQRYT